MPVQITSGRSSSDASDRIPMLEREIGSLRREIESLRTGAGANHAHGSMMTWIAMFLGCAGVLLALLALLRH